MASVVLKNLRKSFGATPVIQDLSLSVASGEFMVFVGGSGCGKSTTLRMIAGLEHPDSGTIEIDGQVSNAIEPSDRGIAMVFQSYALYPHMTVRDNISFPLRMAHCSREQIRQRVERSAEILNIGPLLERYPRQLSGGERQRVAIGRAIVREPKVFLFDEPLSNLDASLRNEMRIEISRLHQELKATMIYVTHDQVEAMTMADRIALFRNGRIEQMGRPLELFTDPSTAYVAGFLGSPRINVLPPPTQGASAGYASFWHALQARTGLSDPVDYAIRPEHVQLVTESADASGTLEFVEHLGHAAIAHVRVSEHLPLLTCAVSEADISRFTLQDKVNLRVNVNRIYAFDPQGRRVPLPVARADAACSAAAT